MADAGDLASPRVTGAVDGPTLVLVHGFTQHGGCWGPVEEDLARDHRLVLPDAPGHGRSADVRTDFHGAADRLAASAGSGTWIGYSMGGRLALGVAVAHPEVVERLVLVGARAGIADPTARAARRAADEALADHLEAVGVATFLDEWLAQPLFAGLTAEAAQRDARLTGSAAGLASALRGYGAGAQPDLSPDLAALAMPVLVLAGERDAAFVTEAHALGDAIGPGATVALVPGAGHTAHLEQPTEFLRILRTWLATTA